MYLEHAEFSMKILPFEQTPKPQTVLHDFHFYMIFHFFPNHVSSGVNREGR